MEKWLSLLECQSCETLRIRRIDERMDLRKSLVNKTPTNPTPRTETNAGIRVQTITKTNTNEKASFKANEPKDIVYRITIQEGAFVEDYTFKRIFFNKKEEGDDFEFIYSIQSYYWEQMMKWN